MPIDKAKGQLCGHSYYLEPVAKGSFLRQTSGLDFASRHSHIKSSVNLDAIWKGVSPWKRFSRPHLAGRELHIPRMMQTGSKQGEC